MSKLPAIIDILPHNKVGKEAVGDNQAVLLACNQLQVVAYILDNQVVAKAYIQAVEDNLAVVDN